MDNQKYQLPIEHRLNEIKELYIHIFLFFFIMIIVFLLDLFVFWNYKLFLLFLIWWFPFLILHIFSVNLSWKLFTSKWEQKMMKNIEKNIKKDF